MPVRAETNFSFGEMLQGKLLAFVSKAKQNIALSRLSFSNEYMWLYVSRALSYSQANSTDCIFRRNNRILMENVKSCCALSDMTEEWNFTILLII